MIRLYRLMESDNSQLVGSCSRGPSCGKNAGISTILGKKFEGFACAKGGYRIAAWVREALNLSPWEETIKDM